MRSSKLNIKFIILFILGIGCSSVLMAEAPEFNVPSANHLDIWENVGTPGFTPSVGNVAHIVLDSNDVPYVAYTASVSPYKIAVKKFNGTNWISVGADGFSDGQAGYISLSIDGADTPYVSYMDRAHSDNLTVQRFDSLSGWTLVGSAGFSDGGKVSATSITHDDSSRTYVAYQEYYSSRITVKKYNGSAWEDVGAAGAIEFGGDISLEISSTNTPYLSYSDSISGRIITVLKYADNNWSSAAPVINNSNKHNMVLNSSDTPYVVFQDYSESQGITVMKYDVPEWTSVGEAGFSNAYVSNPDIAIGTNDVPYVVYTGNNCIGGKATVQKYDGSQWVDVGKRCFSNSAINLLSIALDSKDVPYVAYMEGYSNGRGLTVMNATKYLKFDIAENLLVVGDINATDSDSDPITYSIAGDESSFFEIDSTTGALSFKVAPDYETPQDSNVDNTYMFTVIATANGDTVSNSIQVNVLDAGEIISDGGLATATISLNENIAIATTILGGGTLTLSGLDAASFHINEDTQELIFNTTPNYEEKSSYEVMVTADALGQSDTQIITININDVAEAPILQMPVDWRPVGSTSAWADVIDINIDNTDTPYIVYNGSVFVKRYFNGIWSQVGSAGLAMGWSNYFSLAFDNTNMPYVAFSDSDQANVMKYDSAIWTDVDSASLSYDIETISLAIDSNNIPYVFYSDQSNQDKATVMKYSSGTWILVGSPIGSSDDGSINWGSIGKNSIILDSNDIPYIVYLRYANTERSIDVMKFDGIDWIDVNSSFPTDSYTADTAIAIDHNDTLYVTYKNGNDTKDYAVVMRYSGRRWTQMGSDHVSDKSYLASIELSFDSKNVPYLVYADGTNSNKCSVIKYKDGTWEDVGTPAFSIGTSTTQSLVIDNLDTPYVVYSDESLSTKVIVQKLIPHYNVLENSTLVTDITAFDDENDTITYGVNSGDSPYFDVDVSLGTLSFKTAPDFETPQGTGGSNTYEFVVTASDNNGTTSKRIQVVVIDDPDTDNDGIEDSQDPDADGDGMPNDYEVDHGFDPLKASDANEDYDNDGFTNLEEYNAGTDPKDDTSYPGAPQDPHSFLPAVIMYLLN